MLGCTYHTTAHELLEPGLLRQSPAFHSSEHQRRKKKVFPFMNCACLLILQAALLGCINVNEKTLLQLIACHSLCVVSCGLSCNAEAGRMLQHRLLRFTSGH